MEGDFYGLFPKKTKTKHDVYLQIYESFYDPVRKGSAHRSIRPVKYVKKLIETGIEDPIIHFQHEVDQMNSKHKEKKQKKKKRQISEDSPERFLGYFLIKNIHDGWSCQVKFATLFSANHVMLPCCAES